MHAFDAIPPLGCLFSFFLSMHAFIADPSTPGYPNLARACTQPLTTGPMLAGRSTLIGWTRKIILSLAVTQAYGLPAAALPQMPDLMEVGRTGISGLSISSARPSPLRGRGGRTKL